MNFQTDSKALENCIFSIYSSYSAITSFDKAINSLSNSVVGSTNFGITPPQYLLIIEIVLFNRFPKSFDKSELILSIKLSGVKIPSCPNGTSRSK